MEKRKKKLIIFITELHNKPQGCGALHHKKNLIKAIIIIIVTTDRKCNTDWENRSCMLQIQFRNRTGKYTSENWEQKGR
jgi:hypothetical protein